MENFIFCAVEVDFSNIKNLLLTIFLHMNLIHKVIG